MRLLSRIVIRLIKAIGKLPISFHYKLGQAFSFLLFVGPFLPLCVKIRNNLKIAFPYYSRKEIRAIERLHYRRLLDFGAEFLASVSESEDMPKLAIENIDTLYDSFKSSRFVICYSGHFVNYETLIQAPSLIPEIAMYNFYQDVPSDKSDIEEIDKFITKGRSRFGAHLVPNNTLGIRTILDLKNTDSRNVLIGSLADITNSFLSTPVKLFGHTYNVSSGTERLGRHLNAQFLYANITSPSRGIYNIDFIPLEGDITQSYFNCLEENIRQQPELWTQWATINFQ